MYHVGKAECPAQQVRPSETEERKGRKEYSKGCIL